ncbi:MAG: LysR family transcriptional regulator [Planctomycetota bacterium]|nr:LysR family transcriptional regulator [Planctomycetota bacterium]
MTTERHHKLTAKSKVWLESGGRAVFGDGKAELLEQIEQTGSLAAAAESMGMSYRGLWGRLREMERRLGMKLLVRTTGGRGGGGSQLTDQGRKLLSQYRRFRDGVDKLVDARFKKNFGQ